MIKKWTPLRIWIAVSCVWIAGVALVGGVQTAFAPKPQLVADGQPPAADFCTAVPNAEVCRDPTRGTSFGADRELPSAETPGPAPVASYVASAAFVPAAMLVLWMLYGWITANLQKFHTKRWLD